MKRKPGTEKKWIVLRDSRKPMKTRIISIALFLVSGLTSPLASGEDQPQPYDPPETTVGYSRQTIAVAGHEFEVQVPETFQLELLNPNLESPRMIHFHGDRMFIGSRAGNIYWMDPPYRKTHTLAKMGWYPHSIIIRDQTILVARTHGIYQASYTMDTNWISEGSFGLLVALPGGRGHNSRTLKLGPDGNLYVSLGIRGNCSDEYLDASYEFDSRRGGIHVIDESGPVATLVPFASGLRNPVGFDWHPESKTMYASNNGPDHLGFDQPPEYFSEIKRGSFHGMPWFQFDGEKLRRDPCAQSVPPRPVSEVSIPVATFDPRNAPMDLAFVPSHGKATEFAGDAIVALRGSWGTAPDGSGTGDPATRRHPKLVLVEFENGQATSNVLDLTLGFQSASGERWIRPVGVVVGPDGEIYFTSDSGIQGLYRLKKTEPE
ncbi:MAG: PQQ-dependent sugar dehydrogenase [Gammaproteobacteria bacterium]|nr:PQQ-dependent sugar dehydrogenase [Gammaproteobacteria bacterium]